MYSQKSYAKVNVFLKIVGKRENYHLLASRFATVKNLFDTVSFVPYNSDNFVLEGEFGCKITQNTIYKGYKILSDQYPIVKKFFKDYKVLVEKHIPEFAGLGGGSSNAATFLLMVNDICSLNLSKNKLAKIGATIGADVPFFIYQYDSANVSGVGEIVEQYDEPPLDIKTFTPQIQCNTAAIFKQFRTKFYKQTTDTEVQRLFHTDSLTIYETLDTAEANDLYLPAYSLYNELDPKLLNQKDKLLFSGSGSSFFKINKV